MEELKRPSEDDFTIKIIEHKNASFATERLLLRRVSVNDLNPLYELRADKKTAKLIGKQPARNQGEVLAYIEKINEGIKLGKWLYWTILDGQTKAFMGTICLWNFTERTAEVGYELLPAVRGKGYAREALNCIVDFAFKTFAFEQVEAVVNDKNTKSIELLEKSHFILTGELEEMDEVSPGFVKMLIYTRQKTL